MGAINLDKAFAADSDFVAALMRLANAGSLKLRNMTLDDLAKSSDENIPFDVVVGFAGAGAESPEDISFLNELCDALDATESAAKAAAKAKSRQKLNKTLAKFSASFRNPNQGKVEFNSQKADTSIDCQNTRIRMDQIKKGVRVRLQNGWEAVVLDDCNGNTLRATVFGDFTETGSIYAHDIAAMEVDGQWIKVPMAGEQAQFYDEIKSFLTNVEIDPTDIHVKRDLPEDSPAMESTLIPRALEFATKAYANKIRKRPAGTSYIDHAIAVSKILRSYGCSDEVVAAGLLHELVDNVTLEVNLYDRASCKSTCKDLNTSYIDYNIL